MPMTSLALAPTFAAASRRHWHGDPAHKISGSLAEVLAHIPTFDRTPLGLNRRLDMIVRATAGDEGETTLPVGVVSKKYVLVQHRAVVKSFVAALRTVDVAPERLWSNLTISESGARMALRIQLPDRFAFKAPDGHKMALTFECFNSVDRTVPLFAVLGWFRFVCSNGLVVGTTHARMRRQHRPPLKIDELEPVLAEGLLDAADDRDTLGELINRRVDPDAVRAWVDRVVHDAWGPFAAARVHSIATRGVDGEPSRTPRNTRPHERTILQPFTVPGAAAPARDAYSITQALAWIAARRPNVAERLAWRQQIPELVSQLQ
jgi:Domain of unknown function (DUF932)